MNAFQMARPRGVDTAPSKAPRKTNHSRAPKEGSVHLLLDSNGRRTVSLEPRKGGIVIESREQKLASEAKTARIAREGDSHARPAHRPTD